MLVLIDNYDSFTYNVYHYFRELNVNLKIFRNDQITIEEIKKLKPKGIILSPGPCTPNKAGICLDLIKHVKYELPILGICLGHQSIGQSFGGNIIKCNEIMHGKIDKIKHFNHPIFNNVKNFFDATRYHSLIIEKKSISDELIVIAENKDKIIMGIAHKDLPIYGLQFHPESIGTDSGKTILKNFLELIKYEYW